MEEEHFWNLTVYYTWERKGNFYGPIVKYNIGVVTNGWPTQEEMEKAVKVALKLEQDAGSTYHVTIQEREKMEKLEYMKWHDKAPV
jgi:hypothetical protein